MLELGLKPDCSVANAICFYFKVRYVAVSVNVLRSKAQGCGQVLEECDGAGHGITIAITKGLPSCFSH